MTDGADNEERGQAFGEYAILVAGIAIACVIAALFLSGAISGLFGSTTKPVQPGVFRPPIVNPNLKWPTSIEECEGGGWRNFPQFLDEAKCREYIESLNP